MTRWGAHPEFVTAIAVRGYPLARRRLIDQGFDPQVIDDMSVAQVILLHSYRQYRTMSELQYRACLAPYPDSEPLFAVTQQRFDDEIEVGESLPMMSNLATNFIWSVRARSACDVNGRF